MTTDNSQRFGKEDFDQFCELVNATDDSYYDEDGRDFCVEFKFGETSYALFGIAGFTWFRQSHVLEFSFKFNRVKYHPLCKTDGSLFVCFIEAEGTNEHPRLLLYHNTAEGYYRVIGFGSQSEGGEFQFPKQL